MTFLPTRDAGLANLKAFRPRMGKAYAAGRNVDCGPGQHAAVSALSPYVRHRLISEQELVAEALSAHGAKAAEKFIDEVFWRTYWKGWLEQRPGVWRAYENALTTALRSLKSQPGKEKDYENALSGATGIACFDDWATELKETGYLHNHARMWFASIWIFTLDLPWALGADFFLHHLLDGDPASNTLSWRWVAGLQTEGKAYAARASNIHRYTQGRYNPVGQLTEDPQPLPFVTSQKGPLPAAESPFLSDFTLLVTDDCLDPFTHMPPGCRPTDLIILDTLATRASRGCSPLVKGFGEGAMADLVRRSTKAGCPAQILRPDQIDHISDPKQVVFMHAPVGPNQDRLRDVIDALRVRGIPCRRHIAPFDQAGWPHAKKGFFVFKKAIPLLLEIAFGPGGHPDQPGFNFGE